ncbi:MAG: efflux transporter, family, subunit [Firmicutes bacterium]|nr:efflux transporter, family, subunit [Bacillota bacterium]
MNTKKKKLIFTTGFVVLVLLGIISYRMYANITANKERAAKVSQGRGVAVEIAEVGRRDISPLLTLSANLEPLWNADISAKVDGRIDRLFVDEGDIVSSGMVIGVLDTNELAAQVIQADGTLLSNQASLEQAIADLKRTEALALEGAISMQSLDAARTKRDSAIGQVRSAQGNLSLLQAKLENASIIAPRNGIVLKRYLQAGSYTKAGAQIVSIADVSSLLAKATVAESELREIVVGSQVKIKVNALQDKEFIGNVTRISPTATLPARTFTAEITIPNLDGLLKPGMFGKLIVPGLVHTNALVVPESSLVMRGDQKTVYIVTSENKVQQRMLKLGYVGDGWAEVLEGLQDGERIVVAGQNKLKDGSSINVPGGKEGGN